METIEASQPVIDAVEILRDLAAIAASGTTVPPERSNVPIGSEAAAVALGAALLCGAYGPEALAAPTVQGAAFRRAVERLRGRTAC